MFRGTYQSSIDAKGRMIIPVRFREVLVDVFGDERIFLTKCLVDTGDGTVSRGLSVYPYQEWLALEEKIDGETTLSSAQLNSIKRLILAPAVECTADRQGRVLLPSTLRSYAGLERDLVMVSMTKKFEVWSQETYDRVNAQDERNYPSDSAALAALGI